MKFIVITKQEWPTLRNQNIEGRVHRNQNTFVSQIGSFKKSVFTNHGNL